MTNIGVTSILGSSLSVDQNSKYVMHGVCAATEELVGAWLYCSSDAGGSSTFKIIVHLEAAGIPAGLTHTSSECTIAAGSSWAWRYVTFTAGTNLTSGSHYYFGPHTASGGYNLNLKYQSTGGTNFEKADTYVGGASDPFGSGGGPGTRQYSVYLVTAPANSVPSAPTLGVPANAANVNVDYATTFTWTHNDTDSDAQNEATFAYRESGGAWTEIVVGGATAQKSLPAATFADGTSYEWKVKTSDAVSGYGAYSTARTFTGMDTPTAPTISAPAVDEVITTSSYDIEWSITDQDKFQARVCADSAGSPDTSNVLIDSGQTAEANTRSYTFDLSDYNSTTVHMQVRVEESAAWSDYATARCSISFTPPQTPTVAVTANSTDGYISLTATHLDPEYEVSSTTDSGWASYAADGRLFLPAGTNLETNPQMNSGGTIWTQPTDVTRAWTTAPGDLPSGYSCSHGIAYTWVDAGSNRQSYGSLYSAAASTVYRVRALVKATGGLVGSPSVKLNVQRKVDGAYEGEASSSAMATTGYSVLTVSITTSAAAGTHTLLPNILCTTTSAGDALNFTLCCVWAEATALLFPYYDGTYTGCSWSGSAHASTTSRAVSSLIIPTGDYCVDGEGTIAFRFTPLWAGDDGILHELVSVRDTGDTADAIRIYKDTDNKVKLRLAGAGTKTIDSAAQSWAVDTDHTIVARWVNGDEGSPVLDLEIDGTTVVQVVNDQTITVGKIVIGAGATNTATAYITGLIVSPDYKTQTWCDDIQASSGAAFEDVDTLIDDYLTWDQDLCVMLTDDGDGFLYYPEVTSEDIYRIALDDDNVLTRIATNHAAGTAYADYAVASSFAADGISHRYEYVVRAIGESGTTADSAQTG